LIEHGGKSNKVLACEPEEEHVLLLIIVTLNKNFHILLLFST